MIKLRRMRWTGKVARMEGKRMHVGYCLERQKERVHWEEHDVVGWTILKWILERENGMVWIRLIWLWIGTSGGLL
jgi:hypothetical protein